MQNDRPQGTHMYVLTLSDGRGEGTVSGTITPPAGASRFDTYEHLRRHATGVHPSLRGSTVVFFSLEPNTL
ncbi:hypothetical protein AB0M23_28965 [Streptomyces sp. NPDC052077]|uniref:hypothetical protein n=1 Tax=Streptomyces sp. NPDC052077 TaxID=3154757 RepID=UPI00344AC757